MPEETTVATLDTAPVTQTQSAPVDAPAQPTSTPANPPAAPQDSSTPPVQPQDTTTSPTTPQAPVPAIPVNWEKRYADAQSHFQRQTNAARMEQEQLRKQLDTLTQAQQAQQKSAEVAKLPRWSTKHPDNQKFNQALQTSQLVSAQIAKIPKDWTPAQQQQAQDAIIQGSGLTDEDMGQLRQYREQSQQFQQKLFADPHSALEEIVGPLIRQEMEYQRIQAAGQQTVDAAFNDPTLKPLIEEHKVEFSKMLDDGVPFKYAIHTLKLHNAYRTSQQQNAPAQRAVTQQAAQREIVQTRAGTPVRQNPATTPIVDPYAVAQKRAKAKGMTTDDPRFMRILAEVEAEQKQP